jgi:DNA polymerase elongation subunit (family B)
VQDRHKIFVRAHAPHRSKDPWSPSHAAKWPSSVLIFDTETKIDPTQKLTFGCFRRYEYERNKYSCVEEGMFFADNLGRKDRRVLQHYADNPLNVPETETFLPQLKLKLMTRDFFIRQYFWGAVRRGDLIVGFNLPFDLSRLAVKHTRARKNGWSLVFSTRKSRKTGETEIDIERPRIVVTSINSKMAFFKLSSKWRPKEWRNEPRFLDLRTLTFALRNVAYSLSTACKAFNVPGKLSHTPTGKITPKEIKYCREDVAATGRLLNAVRTQFDCHPLDLWPDKAYSPASIAKAYLDDMNIAHPKRHFKVPNKIHGIAMQAYYGGRAECRIRKTPLPVILTDFTSQYPTVNALLGNWDVLKASNVRFKFCTGDVRKLLSRVELEDTFDPAFWKDLSFFALVKPAEDILPVRTVYNGRTKNIGINYLTSKKSIWYAGPDLVASKLLAGKTPCIIKAIRMLASGEQKKLRSTDLAGTVRIDPRKDDFFIRVIEERNRLKRSNRPVSDFMKVVGNSGSYGLFVQVDPDTLQKSKRIRVYAGETILSQSSRYIEKLGPWYFPPIASLITSGGRLLLAMLEQCIHKARGSYLFCDTDSMCIVGSEKGELVPCVGGNLRLEGIDAVRALSFKLIQRITKKFNRLNPYNPKFVRDILKIEDINHVDGNPSKSRRRVIGYAIAAKRYALYTQAKNNISVVKASGHGLGYLFSPKKIQPDEKSEHESDDQVPEWVFEAWDWLIRREFRIKAKNPMWLGLPAMMRMTMTSPNVMRHNRPEWLAPFNFFLFPMISRVGGYPPGIEKSDFNFIVPFESDRNKWRTLRGINLKDEKIYRIAMLPDGKCDTVVPESFRIVLRQYLQHPEAKSLAPDGNACLGSTQGLLRRETIVARKIVSIGKETDRSWEQGEDPSILDFKLKEYGNESKIVITSGADRKRWRKLGVRHLMRKSGLSQKTVYAILDGEPVRRTTQANFMRAVDG